MSYPTIEKRYEKVCQILTETRADNIRLRREADEAAKRAVDYGLKLEAAQAQNERLRDALEQILEGSFRYNMGDYETCARNAARLTLSKQTEDP